MVNARRQELHELLDQLPTKTLAQVQKYLEEQVRALHDPVLRAMLNAAGDDEPETDQERLAVRASRASAARGEVSSIDEVERRLGLVPPKKPRRRKQAR